jgi:hypothetical protein
MNAATKAADKFDLIKRLIIKDDPQFENICMKFYFANTKYSREPDCLIFAKQDKII